MTPSTRQALELLREGTQGPVSEEREARIRSGIEASVGLALPVAVSAPVAASMVKTGLAAAKALFTTSVSKAVLVAMASVAVGSAATVAVTWLVRREPARSAVVAQPRAVYPEAGRVRGRPAAGDTTAVSLEIAESQEGPPSPDTAEKPATAEKLASEEKLPTAAKPATAARQPTAGKLATARGLLTTGELASSDNLGPLNLANPNLANWNPTSWALASGAGASGTLENSPLARRAEATETSGSRMLENGSPARCTPEDSAPASAANQKRTLGSDTAASSSAPPRPPRHFTAAAPQHSSETRPAGDLAPALEPFSAPPLISADAEAIRCQGSEQKTLKAAQQAFESELPLDALTVLDRHHARCPTGEWSPLSWRLRIRALCALQRHAEAKGLMNWYWVEHPKDARAAQVELGDACPSAVVTSPTTKERPY